jgi:pimeloyl-ACP methyl ester carboxylesterase
MKIRKFLLLLCVLCLAWILSACQANTTVSQETSPSIDFQPCQLSVPGYSYRVSARCGSIDVYEDRQLGSGRKINLNVAVIPAISRNPAPDPLFFLAGGPGEAATQSFIVVYAALNEINQKRDIVLVDQRGTGGSHLLTCPQTEEEENPKDDSEAALKYFQECLAALDANPRFYTTSIAMDDLDEVRQVLGYEKINLYGASYGTRAALVYARQHGDHLRSMILDGLVPLDWSLGPTVSADAQRSLDMLFKRCAEDSACHSTYPDLEQEFQAIFERLNEDPIDISLEHPTTGEMVDITLSQEIIANTIHLVTYTPENASLLPHMIHQAAALDDFGPLAAQTLITNQNLTNAISLGMRNSVLCSEDVPFYPNTTPTDSGYLGENYTLILSDICSVWPAGELPDDFKLPVTSDVPSLLLSGEADPVTPPQNGEQAAQTLANSLHIVAPGQGHITVFRGCIPQIAMQFIETASVQGLDTSCVQNIEPMPFFVNFNGPLP